MEIRELSLETMPDFMDFFDNRALKDNPEWDGCYCVTPQYTEEDARQWIAGGKQGTTRDCAEMMIREGRMRGYLAYAGGKAVGWCNANGKAAVAAFLKERGLWTDGDGQAVTCFAVQPDMRGKGVAKALLARVCGDAKEAGIDFVEAYPKKGAFSTRLARGTAAFYEHAGFAVDKDCGDAFVMRKELRDGR